MWIHLCPGFEIDSKYIAEFQHLINFRYETNSSQSITVVKRMARLFAAIGMTGDILKCTLDILGCDCPTYLRNLLSKSCAAKLHDILLMLQSEDTLCSIKSSDSRELLAGTYLLLKEDHNGHDFQHISASSNVEREKILQLEPPVTWKHFQACVPMALGIIHPYLPARIYRWLNTSDVPETLLRNFAIGFLMLTNVIIVNQNDWHPVMQNDLLDPVQTLIEEYDQCHTNNKDPVRGFCRLDEILDIDTAAKMSNCLLKEGNSHNLLAAEMRASSTYIL